MVMRNRGQKQLCTAWKGNSLVWSHRLIGRLVGSRRPSPCELAVLHHHHRTVPLCVCSFVCSSHSEFRQDIFLFSEVKTPRMPSSLGRDLVWSVKAHQRFSLYPILFPLSFFFLLNPLWVQPWVDPSVSAPVLRLQVQDLSERFGFTNNWLNVVETGK